MDSCVVPGLAMLWELLPGDAGGNLHGEGKVLPGGAQPDIFGKYIIPLRGQRHMSFEWASVDIFREGPRKQAWSLFPRNECFDKFMIFFGKRDVIFGYQVVEHHLRTRFMGPFHAFPVGICVKHFERE